MLYEVRCRSTAISVEMAGSALRITSSVTGSRRGVSICAWRSRASIRDLIVLTLGPDSRPGVKATKVSSPSRRSSVRAGVQRRFARLRFVLHADCLRDVLQSVAFEQCAQPLLDALHQSRAPVDERGVDLH